VLHFLVPFQKWVFLSVLTGTATIAAGVGMLGTSAYLISKAALHPSIAALQVSIVGVRFFGISRGVFRYLERLLSHSVNFRLLTNLRTWFYQKIEPQAPACFEKRQGGDILSRAVMDIESLQDFYVRLVSPIIVAVITSSVISFFVGTWLPQLTFVLLSGYFLNGALLPVIAYSITSGSSGALIVQKASINANLIEWVQGIRDLLVFGAEEPGKEKIYRKSQEYSLSQMRMAWAEGNLNGAGLLIVQTTLIVVLLFAISAVNKNLMDGVLLAAVSLMTLAGFEAVTPLVSAGVKLESSLTCAGRLFEISNQVAPVPQFEDGIVLPESFSLSMRSISFRYESCPSPVLQGINLEMPPGKKIALIGPSGSGKSSLMNLLLRFHEFNEGMIELGKTDIRKIPAETARNVFSVIPQNPTISGETLRKNLLIANPQADIQNLMDALEKALLLDWYHGLPQGMETWLGENGVKISGGERQRLAIARVFLRDTPIMLWDEPFSQIDALTAGKVLENLITFSKNKSILWISHQLSGMEKMDEIAVLKEGKIIERGSFDQLMRSKGLFSRMWTLQNSHFIDV